MKESYDIITVFAEDLLRNVGVQIRLDWTQRIGDSEELLVSSCGNEGVVMKIIVDK